VNQLFPDAALRSPHRRRFWVIGRALLVIVRRLFVPVLLFGGFVVLCVLSYMRLEDGWIAAPLFSLPAKNQIHFVFLKDTICREQSHLF